MKVNLAIAILMTDLLIVRVEAMKIKIVKLIVVHVKCRMFLRSHLSRLEITIAEVREMATVQKGS
jgi:hypothetical protein